MYKTRECVWCGATPTTIEDVWPKWIGRYLGRRPTRQVYGDSNRRGSLRSFNTLSNLAKAKVVCKTCNGGWMKGLEDAANPILKRMFDEQIAIRLPRSDDGTRGALARWAYKTAVMVQYHYRVKGIDVVPQTAMRKFFATKAPPETCVIFLVSCLGSS